MDDVGMVAGRKGGRLRRNTAGKAAEPDQVQTCLRRGASSSEQRDTPDGLVRQLRQEDRLPIVQPAVRGRVVEDLLPSADRRVRAAVTSPVPRLAPPDVQQRTDSGLTDLVGSRRAAEDRDQAASRTVIGSEVDEGRQVVVGVVHLACGSVRARLRRRCRRRLARPR